MSAILSALVTCGPAYEPIDAVRRITNHSTGELGTVLCETLVAAGFAVTCLRGEMATKPGPRNAEVVEFSTNSSLQDILDALPSAPAAIFHAAALCDFEVSAIEGGGGATQKISSGTTDLCIRLRPTGKVLTGLRELFPEAVIVGWKYELEGGRDEALAKARSQIVHANTNACVVNGKAYGAGFGLVEPGVDEIPHFPDKISLAGFLAGWTLDQLKA
ncbi:phosphopantothenate--cysteine ligase [soil metagenome]